MIDDNITPSAEKRIELEKTFTKIKTLLQLLKSNSDSHIELSIWESTKMWTYSDQTDFICGHLKDSKEEIKLFLKHCHPALRTGGSYRGTTPATYYLKTLDIKKLFDRD